MRAGVHLALPRHFAFTQTSFLLAGSVYLSASLSRSMIACSQHVPRCSLFLSLWMRPPPLGKASSAVGPANLLPHCRIAPWSTSSRTPGIHAIAPGPSGDRGEMAMSPPRCACLFSLHSNFGLDVVPQLRAVPKLCAKVLKSHAFQGKRRCFLVVGCLLTLSPCGSDAQPLWERHYELEYQSALLSRYSMLTVEDRPNGAGGATAARKGSWGRRAQ